MVDDIRALVQPLAKQNGNHLQVDCDASIGTTHADLAKVRQVLFNLLGNACEFTPISACNVLGVKTSE